ncbi:MAG: ATP phosphoribosyltransferase [Xanthomonadales bacterium]|nr:ATP phosphoribosyltransferase [Xanthomonadales bacterium]
MNRPERERDRLRIAIQKSGRLGSPARDLLERLGLRFQESRDRLFCRGEIEPIDLLLVRDDDIPGLIAQGVCDLGVVGRNVLSEFAAALPAARERPPVEWQPLGFGGCRLSLAVPDELAYEGPASLDGQRIATSYPALLGDWLRARDVQADIVTLSGSVEIAPRLGQAELICDLVSSGATLHANQLREVEVILRSEAVLAAPPCELPGARSELARQLRARLLAAQGQRNSRLLMLNARRSQLAELLALLPDGEPPSVMALDGDGDDVAIKALCRDAVSWQQMERMKQAGASQLLVLPLEQMLP